MSEHLLEFFPGLKTTAFRITSAADERYNCIAWAVGKTREWWWPLGDESIITWPSGAARELTMDGFSKAFRVIGFEPAIDDLFELGFEKIALFADADGSPSHAARQLPSGLWTSK